VLDDRLLARLAADFAAIPQLRRLRIHTRLPVVLPERVDEALLGWFAAGRLRPVLVLHANHPREFADPLIEACRRLQRAGVLLYNQAVLLRGVNDDATVLAELCRVCGDAGVTPSYLHQLDPVAGAAHFALSDANARKLFRELHVQLPGYLLPRLVRELPGAAGKTDLMDGTSDSA